LNTAEKYNGLAISWSKTHRRTKWFSKLLKLKLFEFHEGPPYLRSIIGSIKAIIRFKRTILLVQGTHGPLALLALILGKIGGNILIIDLHSGFYVPFTWKNYILTIPFKPFVKFFDIIIVHSDDAREIIGRDALKNNVCIVYDPPIPCNVVKERKSSEKITIVFPSGGLADEPINELVREFNKAFKGSNVFLYITGPHSKGRVGNVIFTGYLPYSKYLEFLASSHLVLALTKVEHTILGAAWEAVYCGKPFLISYSKTLYRTFKDVGVFVKDVPDLVRKIIYLTNNPKVLSLLEKDSQKYLKKFKEKHRKQVIRFLTKLTSILNLKYKTTLPSKAKQGHP